MTESIVTVDRLKNILYGASDIIYLDINVGNNPSCHITAVYIDGMVDTAMMNESILKPLCQESVFRRPKSGKELLVLMKNGAIYHGSRKIESKMENVVDFILNGFVALIIDSEEKAVVFETKGYEKRSISEPAEENVIKGPKDSFNEVIRVNTALIRRRIKTPKLRFYEINVGTEFKSIVALAYVDGVVDEKLLSDVKRRINKIDIDRIASSGSIEEAIVDRKYSLVPQTIYTERPDKLCANIMEGKIGLLIDGYPVAYIIPAVLNMFFQSPEDYSKNYIQSSAIRLLRYLCAFLSLVLPAFYVCVTTFHDEMIPTILLKAIIKSKLAVPFTPFVEVVVMMVAFEILLESGMRLPKSIGQTISIIGGLVIGEAAVSANFVSPAVVVAIAITGICGFIIPNQDLSNSFRLARMGLVILSGIAGLFGLSMGLLIIMYYLCTLTTFDVPFMDAYPSKQAGKQTIKDGFFRFLQKGAPK